MPIIPGFEVVVLGGGCHPSSLPRMVIVVLPLDFPIPDMSLLSGVLVARIPSNSVGICGAERGAQAVLLGPPAWPLLCRCAAGTLNVAMVIKAHSPRLPRKRSTTQIQTTIYGPVIFPKCFLFVRFKQGFILHPWKMLDCENTQQGSACALFFWGIAYKSLHPWGRGWKLSPVTCCLAVMMPHQHLVKCWLSVRAFLWWNKKTSTEAKNNLWIIF